MLYNTESYWRFYGYITKTPKRFKIAMAIAIAWSFAVSILTAYVIVDKIESCPLW